MAGGEGFEPPNAGTKTRCLTTWPTPINQGYEQGNFNAKAYNFQMLLLPAVRHLSYILNRYG